MTYGFYQLLVRARANTLLLTSAYEPHVFEGPKESTELFQGTFFQEGPRDRRPRVRGKGGLFSVTAHNFGLLPPSPTMFVSTAARTFVRRAATSTGARRLASTASNAATTAELQSTQKTAAYLTAFAAVAGFGATQLTHKEVCMSKDSAGMKCCYVVTW